MYCDFICAKTFRCAADRFSVPSSAASARRHTGYQVYRIIFLYYKTAFIWYDTYWKYRETRKGRSCFAQRVTPENSGTAAAMDIASGSVSDKKM
jgi:hypothetical protein